VWALDEGWSVAKIGPREPRVSSGTASTKGMSGAHPAIARQRQLSCDWHTFHMTGSLVIWIEPRQRTAQTSSSNCLVSGSNIAARLTASCTLRRAARRKNMFDTKLSAARPSG
jgi:hypothetical protein